MDLVERITDVRQAVHNYPALTRVLWAEDEVSPEIYPLRINEVGVNGLTCVFFMPDYEAGQVSINRAMERVLTGAGC